MNVISLCTNKKPESRLRTDNSYARANFVQCPSLSTDSMQILLAAPVLALVHIRTSI